MAYINRQAVAITSDGSGAGTGYTPAVSGFLEDILYVPDGSVPYDTGVDFTITEEDTGKALLTVTNAGTSQVDYAPRVATVSVTNGAALYAAAGQAVLDKMPVWGRVKIVIAQATASKKGTFYVYLS